MYILLVITEFKYHSTCRGNFYLSLAVRAVILAVPYSTCRCPFYQPCQFVARHKHPAVLAIAWVLFIAHTGSFLCTGYYFQCCKISPFRADMVRYRGTFSGKCIVGSPVLYRYDHIISLYDLKLQAVL